MIDDIRSRISIGRKSIFELLAVNDRLLTDSWSIEHLYKNVIVPHWLSKQFLVVSAKKIWFGHSVVFGQVEVYTLVYTLVSHPQL